MDAFRQMIQGVFGKIILGIIVLAFAAFGIEGLVTNFSNGTNVVATVGNVKIYDYTLEQAFKQQKDKLLQDVKGDSSLIDDTVLRAQVLKNLVARQALLNEADALKLALNEAEVINSIRQIPEFQTNGKYDDQKFATYLQSTGQDRGSFVKSQRDQMALSTLVGSTTESTFVANRDIDGAIILQDEKRHLMQAVIPVVPSTQIPTTQEIQTYYNAHKKDFMSVEHVNFDYVTLDSNQFVSQAKISDEDVKARYQQMVDENAKKVERHALHIMIPVDAKNTDAMVKKQLEDVAVKAMGGADFNALIKQYSKDPAVSFDNGDLGFVTAGVDPTFDKVLEKLTAGQVSAPFKSGDGYHLLKVVEVKTPPMQTFEELKAQIGSELRVAKVDELYNDAVSRINDVAVDSSSLIDIAKANQMTIDKELNVTRTVGATELKQKAVLDVVFSEDATKERKVTTGVSLSPTKTAWIQVTAYRPTQPETLTVAQPMIVKLIQNETAFNATVKKAEVAVNALNAGKTMAEVSSTSGIQFADKGDVSRQMGLQGDLARAVFKLPVPKANQFTAGIVKAKVGDPVISVVAIDRVVKGVATSLPAPERAQLSKMFTEMLSQQELSDYVEFLKAKYKAKMSDSKQLKKDDELQALRTETIKDVK